jgi:hypothetical protein
MTKIIATCLVGAGLMAAATTLPTSQAHEGHDGHDHGTQEAPQLDDSARIAPTESSNGVVTSPPPFETLDSNPAPLRPQAALPSASFPEQVRDQQLESGEDWSQPFEPRLERRDSSLQGPLTAPRTEFDDRRSETYSSDQLPPDAYGLYPESRERDSLAPREPRPWSPRFSQPRSARDLEFYSDCPSSRGSWSYDQPDRYCAAETRSRYSSNSSQCPAGADYSHSNTTEIDECEFRRQPDTACPATPRNYVDYSFSRFDY